VSEQGQRTFNEDTFLVDNSRGLFAVADGVGGDDSGRIASQLVISRFKEYGAALFQNDIRLMLASGQDLLFDLDHQLKQETVSRKLSHSLATTFTGLSIQDDGTGLLLHAGDSRLYGLDSTGALSPLTGEHTLAQELIRQGQVQVDEHAEDALVNCLGQARPDWHEIRQIKAGDYQVLLLCSDGLSKIIPHTELQIIIQQNWTSPQNCLELLINTALQEGSTDNITAVLVIQRQTA